MRLAAIAATFFLVACASSSRYQSECEAKTATFAELVQCVQHGIETRSPDRLEDAKVKLYLTQGQVLIEHIQSGKKTEAQARAAWDQFAADMWPQRQMSYVPVFVPITPAPPPNYKPIQLNPLPAVPVGSVVPNTVIATWTGKSEQATSVTGVLGINCQYQYLGRTFWRMHQGYCPASVDAR